MNDPSQQDERAAALFTSLISGCLAVQYVFARLPFGGSGILFAAQLCGLALLLINGPTVLSRPLGRAPYQRAAGPIWYRTAPALTMFGLLGLCLIGHRPGTLAVGAGDLAAVAGLLCFGYNLFGGRAGVPTKGRWLSILGSGGLAVAFGLLAGALVWGSGYQNPFLEEALLTGSGMLDTFYHMSMASMLRTYGVVSTGLDGIPYTPYHFGSHFVLGRLANLLGVGIQEVYSAAYAIIFIPFLVFSMLLLAVSLRTARGFSSRCIFFSSLLLLLLGFAKFLPATVHEALGLWPEDIIISESFLFGISVACLSIGMMTPVFQALRAPGGYHCRGALMLLPFLIAACGICKISVALPLAALFFYLTLRLELYRHRAVVASLLITAVLFVWVMRIGAAGQRDELRLEPWFFLKNFVAHSFWLYFFLFHFFWSWTAALVRLRQEGVQTLEGLWQALRRGRLLDIEALLVICVVGAVPCLVLPVAGGSGFYFSAVQWWLALPLLLSVGRAAQPGQKERWRATPLSAVAVVLLAVVTAWQVADYVPRLTAARKKLATEVTAELRRRAQLPAVDSRPPPPARQLVSILAALHQIAELPQSVKRRSLLYIPSANQAYWTLGSRRIVPFIAPALTGVAMVAGIPAFPEVNELVQLQWCGFTAYSGNARLAADPCRRTAQLGFAQLFVLEPTATGDTTVRTLSCPAE